MPFFYPCNVIFWLGSGLNTLIMAIDLIDLITNVIGQYLLNIIQSPMKANLKKPVGIEWNAIICNDSSFHDSSFVYQDRINCFHARFFNWREDVMTWTPFLHYWPLGLAIHLSPVDSPCKGPVIRDLDVLFWCEPQQADEQTVELPVIRASLTLLWRHPTTSKSSLSYPKLAIKFQ